VSRRAPSIPLPQTGLVLLCLLALADCRARPAPGGQPATGMPDAAQASAAVSSARPAAQAVPQPAPVDPLQQARIVEVQHIIDEGALPGRLGRFISGCTGEPPCQVARRMALGALRVVRDRPQRLAALIEAGQAPSAKPEDDSLWPDLVQALSETWAAANTAGGRKRMLREKDPRIRLLLVSSLAVYAASNRGLSDLTMPQRRALRREFMRLYPALPADVQGQIDAFETRIGVNARGTL